MRRMGDKALRRVLSLAVLAFVVTIAAGAQENVTFRLNWLMAGEGDLAPFFVADSRGYYQDNGLSVEVQKGSGSGDAVRLVEVGRADIGVADFPSIALAIAGGADLRIVGAYHTNSPNSVWARSDSGISEPSDLPGHTIGSPAGDAQRIAWPAFAQAVGIGADSVSWVNISPAAKISSLAAGRIDATVHFMDQQCLYRDAVGQDNLEFFRWADYGVNPYGLMIFASNDTIEERPDVIRGFLDGVYRGLQWSIGNPREAIEVAREYRSEVDVDKVLSMLLVSMRYMLYPGDDASKRLGYMQPSRMRSSAQFINENFDADRTLNAAELYTNRFVPRHNWPSASELGNRGGQPFPEGINTPCQ